MMRASGATARTVAVSEPRIVFASGSTVSESS